jgi:hypothetical protein
MFTCLIPGCLLAAAAYPMCMSGGRDWEESGMATPTSTPPRLLLSGNVYSKQVKCIEILIKREFIYRTSTCALMQQRQRQLLVYKNVSAKWELQFASSPYTFLPNKLVPQQFSVGKQCLYT